MEYQKKEERFINYRTLLLIMSEVETLHDVVEEEIHFKEDVPIVERSTPPHPDHVERHGRHNRGVGRKVRSDLQMPERSAAGFRKGQLRNVQYDQGRPCAGESPRTAHRGNARGDHRVLGKM